MKKTFSAILFATFAFVLSSGASGTRYLIADPATIRAQIPPPPADDSPAGMADVETLLQVQKDRTPEQVGRARHVASHNCMQMGANLFGPEFTEKNLPLTEAFLRGLTMERRPLVLDLKKHWNRTRPYKRGLGIRPCVGLPAENDASYPSGHSSAAGLWATIYGAALPEYEVLFQNEMRETMWGRVLGGVHYPTDTQAGKKIGVLIAKAILENPASRKPVAEMRAEIMAFLEARPEAIARAQKRLAEANAGSGR
ncbi:MAG: phosphatase PAP2 family protein [Opitutaceae bacterium]|jgi:acid phosphatase (class A)|nr:phosphatase PAP2 family protein [Opitutaceae bacterium]